MISRGARFILQFGLSALLMLPGSVLASSTEDEIAVKALDARVQRAVFQHDINALNEILADNYILVRGKGVVLTKVDLIRMLRGKSIEWERQENTERKVRLYGDTAIVTALLWEKGTRNGQKFDFHLWVSDVYVRTGSGWRYVFAQSSTPLAEPPAMLRPPATHS